MSYNNFSKILEDALNLDIAPIALKRVDSRRCEHLNHSTFPAGVSAPTQYGPRIKGLAVYLYHYQFLPFEPFRQCFEDLFGHSPSVATIHESLWQAAHSLHPLQQQVAQALIQSPLVHFDETSLFENKQRRWLHSASTEQMTFYFIHHKRGKAGKANSIASSNATTTSAKKHSSSLLQVLKKRNEDTPNRRKQKIYSIV